MARAMSGITAGGLSEKADGSAACHVAPWVGDLHGLQAIGGFRITQRRSPHPGNPRSPRGRGRGRNRVRRGVPIRASLSPCGRLAHTAVKPSGTVRLRTVETLAQQAFAAPGARPGGFYLTVRHAVHACLAVARNRTGSRYKFPGLSVTVLKLLVPPIERRCLSQDPCSPS